jgi:hydrogenase maturation protein HypF
VTSSAGRLFDAVAAIIGLNQRASFEGQAAVELESLTALDVQSVYAFNLWKTSPVVFDWQSMIGGILDDVRQRERTSVIAAKFHNTLAEVAVAVARLAGEKKVLLTGGCFQNRYLVERTVKRLRDAGFVPYWHQHIPPNDGGIALGQIVAALRHLAVRQEPTEVCYAVSAAS